MLDEEIALLIVKKIIDQADYEGVGYPVIINKRIYFTVDGVKMAVVLNPN